MGLAVSRNNRVVRMKHEGDGQDPSRAYTNQDDFHVPFERQQRNSKETSQQEQPKQLTIVHFNDVYNIEAREKEPVGGAARFKTKLDSLHNLKPMVVFSGDALAPSNMSTVTEGRQMVPVLNSLNIQASVYGNHDFDFGVNHLVDIAKQTNFPWLMSNVIDRDTDAPLGNGKETLVMTWEGVKVGLLGLVEEEWLATLATLTMEDVIFTDCVEVAKKLVPSLKGQGCELIIALTHMRAPNDKRLAENVRDIHLVLGGHDHHYESIMVNDTLILKSGSDFRDFSQLTVTLHKDARPTFEVQRHTITKNIPEDEETAKLVQHYWKLVEEGMEEEIGRVECELDGRFSYIRTQETNLGNLVADVMKNVTRADCALLNSGTLRSDTLHEAGVFKMKDLMAILPMADPLVVLELTGEQLLAALENGVSQYPKQEGRFPQVSGLSFSFNPQQPSRSRVLSNTVCVNGKPLETDKKYKLCTKAYLADGKDGYDVFKSANVLLNQEDGPMLNTTVRQYLTTCMENQMFRAFPHASCVSIHSAIGVAARSTDKVNPQVEGRIKMTG